MRKMVISLSPTEQKIYSKLYPKRVIKTSDVLKILGDPHKSADYITNLRSKGFLQKIKQGVYVIVPPDMVEKEYIADKFLVAGTLKDTYYISHHSALELHGVAESVFNTVYITIKNYSQPVQYQNIKYDFVSTKHFFGTDEIRYKSSNLFVSDIEKTVLDCIRRIKYSGGLEELIKSISSIPSVNYTKLWNYLKKFDEGILYHKTGFIFESLEMHSPPTNFMNKMQEKISKKVYYLDKNKASTLNSKWRLMVPNNFVEMIRIV
ncbi:MAG: type IV toxin-antitoxin system AbiEi family antitoxin domain-containing protein [Candidatus Heimdallarchaeaceae archaeon]